MRPVISYLTTQVGKLNIKVRLGEEATVSKILAEKPDAVVIATEWTEFSALDFAELKTALRQPVLFDLRNVYRKADAEAAGLEYHGTGVAPTQGSAGA